MPGPRGEDGDVNFQNAIHVVGESDIHRARLKLARFVPEIVDLDFANELILLGKTCLTLENLEIDAVLVRMQRRKRFAPADGHGGVAVDDGVEIAILVPADRDFLGRLDAQCMRTDIGEDDVSHRGVIRTESGLHRRTQGDDAIGIDFLVRDSLERLLDELTHHAHPARSTCEQNIIEIFR